MAPSPAPGTTKTCPFCGEEIQAVAKKCRFCREYLDPSARPAAPPPDAVERMLLPVGRPASAIAAGYLGLLALFPIVGFVFGILAVIFGWKALRRLRTKPEMSGRGRAFFGIIAGSLSIVLHGLGLVLALVDLVSKR